MPVSSYFLECLSECNKSKYRVHSLIHSGVLIQYLIHIYINSSHPVHFKKLHENENKNFNFLFVRDRDGKGYKCK